MQRRTTASRTTLAILCLCVLLGAPAGAQERSPAVRGLISGFGSVTYGGATEGPFDNDFTALFAPMVLYQVGDDILFEGELDLELEEAATNVHLEHAQIHFLGFEHVQLTAGMMHLPFGVWMHSRFVNRLPTPPLLYEDSHGAPPGEGLLPILFDVGVLARVSVPLVDGWRTSAAFWVSQGPASGLAHSHGAGSFQRPASDAPELGIGANFEDNNSDKMVGLRLRAVSAGGLTLQTAGFRGAYDADGDLTLSALNVSVVWAPGSRTRPLFDLRGEGIVMGQEYLDAGAVESVTYGGYYLQLSRRLDAFEPVVRWSQLLSEDAGPGPVVSRRRQTAVGLNYWVTPSVPIKAAYNFEPDGGDSFMIEWTVGF